MQQLDTQFISKSNTKTSLQKKWKSFVTTVWDASGGCLG